MNKQKHTNHTVQLTPMKVNIWFVSIQRARVHTKSTCIGLPQVWFSEVRKSVPSLPGRVLILLSPQQQLNVFNRFKEGRVNKEYMMERCNET